MACFLPALILVVISLWDKPQRSTQTIGTKLYTVQFLVLITVLSLLGDGDVIQCINALAPGYYNNCNFFFSPTNIRVSQNTSENVLVLQRKHTKGFTEKEYICLAYWHFYHCLPCARLFKCPFLSLILISFSQKILLKL